VAEKFQNTLSRGKLQRTVRSLMRSINLFGFSREFGVHPKISTTRPRNPKLEFIATS